MHDVALTWEQAAWLTAGLGVVALALTFRPPARPRGLAAFARETTMISGLYALWQLAGTLSVFGTDGALARARWIERTERTWHLPSEATIQHATTGHSAFVAQATNVYYATMHFGGLFLFLLWLFLRHRDQYRPVRRVLALTTFVCLLIQLIPVAPPRLLPDAGYVDTGLRYGQSVYGPGGFGADELSAMPSVHVAWAVLIGWATLRIARGPARWIGPLHAVLTTFVVVATANHFWADGIVAVAVLWACGAAERVVRARVAALRAKRDPVLGLSAEPNESILR